MSDSACAHLWWPDAGVPVDVVDPGWAADRIAMDDVTARLEARMEDPDDPSATAACEALRVLEEQLVWHDVGAYRIR
jgi:hypothetical protein